MLEQILKPDKLEKKPGYAFLVGFIYAIIGIVTAYFVFPKSQGIASIAFLSALLIPTLSAMFAIEQKQDSSAKKFSFKRIWLDHNDILQVYFMLFLGIFLAYALLSIKFNNLLVSGIFDSQLRIIGANVGQAVGGLDFYSILFNNVKVMLIFLVLSLIFGAGSILFLSWNASVWGVVFGFVAAHYNNAFNSFFGIFLKVMPHMFLEAGGYFFAIIAGGIISQATLREKLGSKSFDYTLKDGFSFITVSMILLILGAVVEVYVFPLF